MVPSAESAARGNGATSGTGRYQDYVIKDGRLVGRFDEMYQEFPDPWCCAADTDGLDNNVLCALLQQIAPDVTLALDVGCGLGSLSARIREAAAAESLYAVDISPFAIDEAKRSYPGIQFGVFDLLKDSFEVLRQGLDLVTMAEVCWYLIPDIHRVLVGLNALLRPKGHLVVLQHFYGPGEQKYGNEVMETPEDLAAHLEHSGFLIIRTIYLAPRPPMRVLIWATKF